MNEHIKEARNAFDKAIKEGRLTEDKTKDNWAGHYMFMGFEGGKDLFKNIMTRKYDV